MFSVPNTFLQGKKVFFDTYSECSNSGRPKSGRNFDYKLRDFASKNWMQNCLTQPCRASLDRYKHINFKYKTIQASLASGFQTNGPGPVRISASYVVF